MTFHLVKIKIFYDFFQEFLKFDSPFSSINKISIGAKKTPEGWKDLGLDCVFFTYLAVRNLHLNKVFAQLSKDSAMLKLLLQFWLFLNY